MSTFEEIFSKGGWKIEYCPPCDFLTEEANLNNAFMVQRVIAPYGTKKNRHWFGATPLEALISAIDDLTEEGLIV